MEFIGDETYDAILRLHIAQSNFIKEEYNLVLDMINDLMGLEGELKYSKLSDCKNLKDRLFEKKLFKKKLLTYSPKIEELFGFEINSDNKPVLELRKILKKINYNLKYNTKYECYSIVPQ